MSKDYFTPERIAMQRREIMEQGFLPDDFLEEDPDCPVFGINLACAHPFPPEIADAYDALARRLAALDEGVYVYPLWETHLTILTFVNFTLNRRPASGELQELRGLVDPVRDMVGLMFKENSISAFEIEFHPPVLTRKAAILPVSNPTGEIFRMRQILRENESFLGTFRRYGLNIPEIIHSTIMRLKRMPGNCPQFMAGFDAIASSAQSFSMNARQIFLTIETKPYMRQGEIAQVFPLA